MWILMVIYLACIEMRRLEKISNAFPTIPKERGHNIHKIGR